MSTNTQELTDSSYPICPYCKQVHDVFYEYGELEIETEIECEGCEKTFMMYADQETTVKSYTKEEEESL